MCHQPVGLIYRVAALQMSLKIEMLQDNKLEKSE